MAFDIKGSVDFLNFTLSRWLTAEKKQLMCNELLGHSYIANEMIRTSGIKPQGGKDVRVQTLIKSGDYAGPVAPFDVRELKAGQHSAEATADWSFLEARTSIAEEEKELNDADRWKLFDLWEGRQEVALTDLYNLIESYFWDSIGNFNDLAVARRRFPGIKAWITRTGLAVDGTASVFGISTQTYPDWLNRYCGPLGNNLNKDHAHDTALRLTHAGQLLEVMKRAARYAAFANPGNLKYAQADGAVDVQIKLARSRKIIGDEIAVDAFEKLQETRNRADVMTNRDTASGAPVFRGIEVEFCEFLGLDSGGIPATARVNTARGDLTSLTAANTGELFFLNLMNFFLIPHKEKAPHVKPVEAHPLQNAIFQITQFWLSCMANSRQRQVCLWGFGPLQTQ